MDITICLECKRILFLNCGDIVYWYPEGYNTHWDSSHCQKRVTHTYPVLR